MLYDFGGMTAELAPFYTFEGLEAHGVTSLHYANGAPRFVAAMGDARLKLCSREGDVLAESARGDPYLRDQKNTKGHTGAVCNALFAPDKPYRLISGSVDGTVRLWDVAGDSFVQSLVMRTKSLTGQRVAVTACAWSGSGAQLAAACDDGSIQFFDPRVNIVTPTATILSRSHGQTAPATGVRAADVVRGVTSAGGMSAVHYATGSSLMLTRALDSTLRVWDVRATDKPVKTFGGLLNRFAQTNAIFSPTEHLILAACSASEPGASAVPGRVLFIDSLTLDVIHEHTLEPALGSAVRVAWHDKMNQIFITTSSGRIAVLYDPESSKQGVLRALARQARRPDLADEAAAYIHETGMNLEELAQARGVAGRKRKRGEPEPVDPRKATMPQPPSRGPEYKVRLGAPADKSHVQSVDSIRYLTEDPREAILRHASAAAAKPLYTAAYAETQPEVILQEDAADDEERYEAKRAKLMGSAEHLFRQ